MCNLIEIEIWPLFQTLIYSYLHDKMDKLILQDSLDNVLCCLIRHCFILMNIVEPVSDQSMPKS